MKVAPLNESYNSNDRDISKNENVPHEFIYVKPASKKSFIIYYIVELQKVKFLYYLIADKPDDLSSSSRSLGVRKDIKDLAHIVNVLAQNQVQPQGIVQFFYNL